MSKKESYNQMASLVLGVCIMSGMAGCQEDHAKTKVRGGQKTEQIEEIRIDGKYEVKFVALNTSVSGVSNAKANIHVIADRISVGLEMKESPAESTHSQFIYSASECPNDLNDTNNDGYIDPVEASKVLGSILIPLDGDLSSQTSGLDDFPVSDSMGNYSYYQESILSDLISDLKSKDMNPDDELVKLLPKQNLQLEGKVIIIQGISDEVYLPGSIQTIGTNSDRATLPIACGKISRIVPEESETIETEENI